MAKIAVLLPDLRPGGVERMRIVLAKEWLNLGHSVEFVLLTKHGVLYRLLPEEVTVVHLNTPRIRQAIFPLACYLQNNAPDIMLIAMWPLTCAGILAALLSRFGGKVIVSDHTSFRESPLTSSLPRRLLFGASVFLTYPLAHARIGVSKGVVEDLSLLSHLPAHIFKVIHNPAAMTPMKHESQTGCSSKKIILSVGTFKPQKDLTTLLRAFALLPASLEATLVLVGDGEERGGLETLAHQLGITERVQFTGVVLDTSPHYGTASVFVLSSRCEGFANVIVEALSHGTPVISTDCRSGPSEILENGKYGDLVPVGDVSALAQAMERALTRDTVDPESLRRRAVDFSPFRIAKKYLGAMGLT